MEHWPLHWLHLIGTDQIRITRKSVEWFRWEWHRLYGEDIDLSQVRDQAELHWVRPHVEILVDRLVDEDAEYPVFVD